MNNNFHSKRIAVLAVTSPANATGGAERFYRGLVNAIQKKGLNVELISFPCDESSFESIQKSYEFWRALDLSSFDLVISTKSPTYAVNHPNHVMYLVHTIRVFYDLFNRTPYSLLLQQRQEIHRMDTEAFLRVKHRFSIGEEVSKRLREWNGLDAEVMHPPTVLDCMQGEAHHYFFMPGRLHGWKRVDLAIKAMKLLKNSSVKLLIAGTGDAEIELKDLAKDDPRVVFLGHVSDDELIKFYSEALAVIFVPIQEDYGYVALEAFKSGKPVITCEDSGEPLKFVKPAQTGYICEPNPQSLSAMMKLVWENKGKAKDMGFQGLKSIAHITWDKVVNRLLEVGFSENHLRPKVAIIDMQPITPTVGGGRLRLYGLYHALGDNIEAKYVGSYDWPGEKFRREMLTPHLEEIVVPLSDFHHLAASLLAKEAGDKVVIDLAFPRLGHLSQEYIANAEEVIHWADIVVFSHPWAFPLLKQYLKKSQLIVYDAQNVEGFLRAQLLNLSNPFEQQLLQDVVKAESEVGQRADLIIVCSVHDKELFNKIYEWPMDKINVVPNGVMVSKITLPTFDKKMQAKRILGLPTDRLSIIFLGSLYQPNVEAAKFIVNDLAPYLPSVDFIIAGGVTQALTSNLPDNLKITSGFLEESQKILWLQAADIALNPMFTGSGTNIKMFDFMAAGLPIISTRIGARGINEVNLHSIRLADRYHFLPAIIELIHSKEFNDLGIINRMRVESDFAWEKITASLGKIFLNKLQNHRQVVISPLAEKNYPSTSKSNNKLRIAFFGNMGMKCGIAEYSLRLIDHFQKHIPKLVITCDNALNDLHLYKNYTVVSGWYYDNIYYKNSIVYPGLTAHLQEWQAHVILIQYHEAFLSPHAFQQMLFSILELGLKIIVIIHKFVGCDINVFSNLQNKGVQFLSHSRREIQSAAEVGLDIRFMPHGIMVPSVIAVKTVKGRDFKVNPPVITSTGFLRSHKGLLKLIYAVSLMQRRYPGTKLILQCALYRSQDSEETLIRCRNTIRECNLDQLVEMNIEFLPIDAVHNALRRADIAVLPYEMSDEGGSGSASTCLASGLPVVVSKAMIFDELCEVTYQLEDTSPETIAESLLKIFDEPTIYEDLIKKTHEYIRTVSYENISRRIVELFEEKILLNEVHTGDFHMSNASDEYYVFQNAECIL